MPIRKARPANQTKKTAQVTKMMILRVICQNGMVVYPIRIIMVMGAVRGKKLSTSAKVPLGFDMIVLVM